MVARSRSPWLWWPLGPLSTITAAVVIASPVVHPQVEAKGPAPSASPTASHAKPSPVKALPSKASPSKAPPATGPRRDPRTCPNPIPRRGRIVLATEGLVAHGPEGPKTISAGRCLAVLGTSAGGVVTVSDGPRLLGVVVIRDPKDGHWRVAVVRER